MADVAHLQSLLSRVALGDRKAFRALYDAAAPSLFGVALRILKRRDRAEDVLQDAFVSVWQRAASYSAADLLDKRKPVTLVCGDPPPGVALIAAPPQAPFEDEIAAYRAGDSQVHYSR